ncbi:hypothetical protein [Edwardsiella ictaluri]|uniref:hypothetical protein n=1 Tax=Edwardsiella ictaluri TaxID=67780 RepID=UPI0039F6FB5A
MNVDRDNLIQIGVRIQRHHRRHQLGYRGDRHLNIGVAGVDNLMIIQIHHHRAARCQRQRCAQLGSGTRLAGLSSRKSADAAAQNQQT